MDKLSIEKEFEVKRFETVIQDLSDGPLRALMVDMYRQFLAREQLYQEIMKESLFK